MTIDELNQQLDEFRKDPRVIAHRAQKAAEARQEAERRYRDQRAEQIAFEERVRSFNEMHRKMS